MLLLIFVFLLVLHLDTVLLLELLEPQRVGHQSLISSLFLLFDSEQRILSDFGGSISYSICKLRGNKGLV